MTLDPRRVLPMCRLPALLLLALAARASASSQDSCSPDWVPSFGSLGGPDREVLCLERFDDGNGMALYVGGRFSRIDDLAIDRLARWDGHEWSAIANPCDGAVVTLTVWDDGTGPALYAGGSFHMIGGVPASGVAKWDGSTWTALGLGIGISQSAVFALAGYDDGTGPALYAGGDFNLAGGHPAHKIAKWDGTSWSALPTGPSGNIVDIVWSLRVFDDGSGPALVASGYFPSIGGLVVNSIAKWNGSVWASFGAGREGTVRSIEIHDDGSGPALYATDEGSYSYVNTIARWDGAQWTEIALFPSGTFVPNLRSFDAGGGPRLIASIYGNNGGIGEFRQWDGTSWSLLFPTTGYINTTLVHDDGNGPAFFAGGDFRAVDGVGVRNIARWDGMTWFPLGSGTNDEVYAFTEFDDGSGPVLVAGGRFTSIAGVSARGVASWDGTTWSALGTGMNRPINVLTAFDDGSGPAVYAGGQFQEAGGQAASFIARWDGSEWSPLDSGTDHWVLDLAVFDDGTGPALHACGLFHTAGGVAANFVAKWDGAAWSPLGSGPAPYTAGDSVSSMVVYDDGGGPALFVAGRFASTPGFAKWDGTSWSYPPLASVPRDMVVHDDGSGPALYLAMSSTVLRWDGATTIQIGPDFRNGASAGTLQTLSWHDLGAGPRLFVGGRFTSSNGVSLANVAMWDGASWSALGSGVSSIVQALTSLVVNDEPSLVVGGSFLEAYDSGDSYIARWAYPADAAPILSAPESVRVLDVPGSPPGEIVDFTVSASDCRDPAPTVVCTPPSGSFFPQGTTWVHCTATDDAGNVSSADFPVTVALKVRRR